MKSHTRAHHLTSIVNFRLLMALMLAMVALVLLPSPHQLASGLHDQSRMVATPGVFTRTRSEIARLMTIAPASTLSVTNTNDSGAGSLRQAILDANNSVGVPDTIGFNIPGSDTNCNVTTHVCTISPAFSSPLPAITDPVTIDGYTQPFSSVNTGAFGAADNAVLTIELNGAIEDPPDASCSPCGHGLVLGNGSNGSIIRGLVINRFNVFDAAGILVTASSGGTLGGSSITGNFIGTNAAGTARSSNFWGVEIQGSTNNTIGGTTPAARNIISGNSSAAGIETTSGGNTNTVQGNYIGTDTTGAAALAQPTGILIRGSSNFNQIGGSAAGAGNVIAGSNSNDSGIEVDGSSNTIQGNRIGTAANGTDPLRFTNQGIVISGSTNTVGGTNAGEGNLIANCHEGVNVGFPTGGGNQIIGNTITKNGTIGGSGGGVNLSFGAYNTVSFNTITDNFCTGVLAGGHDRATNSIITDNTISGTKTDNTGGTFGQGIFVNAGTGHQILRNSIYNNDRLGIDLVPSDGALPDGVTLNDPCDADTGTNNLQNFPVITSAITSGSAIAIQGTLNSTSGRFYRIEFFANQSCDPSGHGQGQLYLGAVDPAGLTDNNCSVSFSATFNAAVTAGNSITATATDKSTNDTSEFSACQPSIGGSVPAPTPTPTPTCAPTPSGMVSWWPGDGNANDIKDGNNGTAQNGATFAAGKVGQAFSFSGSSSRIAIADAANLTLTHSLTLDAWIQVTALPADTGMIVFRGDDSAVSPYYLAVMSTGKVRFHIGDSVGNAINLEGPISLNQWVHVAGTVDDTTSNIALYVNGTMAASTNNPTRPFGVLSGASPGVAIGNREAGASSTAPFNGSIDEVEIFDRALSQAEVQVLYNADTTGKCGKPTPTPTPTPTPLVCPTGFLDCNSNPADGCEIDGRTDNNNCGSCGNVCPAGTHCSGSGCVANPTPTPTPTPTATPSPTPTPTPLILTFDGRLRDRVSRHDGGAGLNPDGDPDGTFSMTLPPETFTKLINKIVLSGPGGDVWDTIPNNTPWTVGLTRSLDGSFENTTDGSLNNVPVGNTGLFKLFASSATPDVFTQGSQFTATVTFNDASTVSGSVTLTKTAAVDLSIVNLTANPSPATERQKIDYTIRIVNNGTELATGVKLGHQFVSSEDYLSGGVSHTGAGAAFGTCTADNLKVVCTVGNPFGPDLGLRPGEDATIDIFVMYRDATNPAAGHATFIISSNQTDANVSDNSGQITVPLGKLPKPGNDDIANAQVLPSVDNGPTDGIPGNNFGATRQSDLNINGIHMLEPMHAGQFGDSSVWYQWTAPSDGGTDFFTTTSKFNTLLGVYTFDDGFFNEVISNDDAAPGVTWSKVHFDAVANKTYYIAVDGYLGAAGDLSLDWIHTPVQPAPAVSKVTNICGGAHPDCPQNPGTPQNPNPYPAFVCTANSTDPDFCPRDAGGFTVITIKGTNFTSDSQIIMRGDALKGFFDKAGTQPINGSTDFIDSSTLVAHIPPYPQLTNQDLAANRIYTFTSSATARSFLVASFTDGKAFPDPGTYRVSENIAMVGIIEVQNLVIPPSTTRTVCGNVPNGTDPGEQTCMDFVNFGPGETTVRPSWFAQSVYCDHLHYTQEQCIQYGEGPQALDKLMHAAFAFNFAQPVTRGTIIVSQSFLLTPGAVGIASDATVIAQGGGNVIAQGGGNIIAQGGGNVIAAGGGNIIAQRGGNIIAQGGGNIIAQGGGNIIAQGGGNIIAQGGGNIIAQGGGNSTRPDDLFVQPTAAPPMLSAADLQNGSKGWFVTSSSGGNAPTINVTTNLDGTMTGTVTMTFDQTSSPRIQDLQGLVFTVVSNPAVVKLASNNITVNEGDGRATVTLTRTGDTTTTVSVNFATSDGTATERTDFMPVYGGVTFGPGETQKTVSIPLIDNGYGPGSGAQRSFNFTIGNAVGGALQMPNVATITINNNDPTDSAPNPLNDASFFVRQQYLDFLSREPDTVGFANWVATLGPCPNGGFGEFDNPGCDRVHVSAGFFLSEEFRIRGYWAYRFYEVGLDRRPTYTEFVPDMEQVGGTQSPESEAISKATYIEEFVLRTEFQNRYAGFSNTAYVNALETNAEITLSNKQALIDALNGGTKTRAQVLREIVESQAVEDRFFIRSFVAMQYFGYLRRDPDTTGYNNWVTTLTNDPGNYRHMIFGFIYSLEYRQRFGP
jgi:Concanavalin A-like lectin/glucanases superfamily/Calx-beta domain/Right handed beta helix region/Domain of unknown function DUF11/Domain of unknown function (DUF4214)